MRVIERERVRVRERERERQSERARERERKGDDPAKGDILASASRDRYRHGS